MNRDIPLPSDSFTIDVYDEYGPSYPTAPHKYCVFGSEGTLWTDSYPEATAYLLNSVSLTEKEFPDLTNLSDVKFSNN